MQRLRIAGVLNLELVVQRRLHQIRCAPNPFRMLQLQITNQNLGNGRSLIGLQLQAQEFAHRVYASTMVELVVLWACVYGVDVRAGTPA
jgi:hypothetical protein